MIPVDAELLREVAPRFSGAKAMRQAQIITEVGSVLQGTLDRYEINTRLRIAHFIAQICHESAGFRTTEEFADGSAYEGRADLGNKHAGDGRRYKGRGLLQLTGRANYRTFGKAIGVDLENNPKVAGEPELSLVIACEYWKRRGLNGFCDTDDLVEVTRRVNGGRNGLDDRRNNLAKAKAALARLEGVRISGGDTKSERAVLRRGSKNDDVIELQRMLHGLGFPIATDGDFGAATELAVMGYQAQNGLLADGIVGPETWRALGQKRKVKEAA